MAGRLFSAIVWLVLCVLALSGLSTVWVLLIVGIDWAISKLGHIPDDFGVATVLGTSLAATLAVSLGFWMKTK